MNFEPSKNYEALLRQARSLASMVNSMEKQLSFYRAEPLAKDDAKYKALQDQIEGEREMNCILTNELDAIKSNAKNEGRDGGSHG